ncbi:MAG: hypothetical protein ABW277_06645 [Longimicrobiaceae bacterium]
MKRASNKGWIAGLLLGVAVGLTGCTDAGTDVDDQIPTGLVVRDSGGNTVATVSGAQVSGSITVPNGQQRTFDVQLIGIGGAEIDLGGRYVLQPRVVSLLANVSVSGSDRVVVTGRTAGTTTLILDVMDGGTAVLTPLISLTIS